MTFGFLTFKNVTFNEFNVATKSLSTNIQYSFVFSYSLLSSNIQITLEVKWFILLQVVNFVCWNFLEKMWVHGIVLPYLFCFQKSLNWVEHELSCPWDEWDFALGECIFTSDTDGKSLKWVRVRDIAVPCGQSFFHGGSSAQPRLRASSRALGTFAELISLGCSFLIDKMERQVVLLC